MMLESGGLDYEQEAQTLNRCETGQVLFDGARRGRKRGLGGATECWGGQLLPLEPIDFTKRPWIEHSGWPIALDDMAPYYRLALKFAGSDELNFDSDICGALGRDSPFDPQVLRYYFSKWSPHPRFRTVLGEKLRQSSNVQVFLHATVTRIELNKGRDRVTALRAVNTSGHEYVFAAECVLLCTGGIETPRLLLTNAQQAPEGIGNEHDLVGRFFHDHPNVRVGTVRSADPQQVRALFADDAVNGLEVSPRLSVTPQLQREHGLLNASAHVWFRYPRTMLQRLPLLNLARRIGVDQHATRNLVDAGLLLGIPTVRMLREGARLGNEAQFTITVVAEQEPCADSRITLSSRRDRFGVPRAKICWHLTDRTWDTVVKVSETVRSELRRVGLGELILFPHITAGRAYWRVFPLDGYHHMGATRMATSPEAGVVDENCQVFGIHNLFVASSSVFPTGGHSNCTLTIMALALRLADHLGLSPQLS